MYTIHSSSLGSSTKTYKTIQQAMAVARWFSTRDSKRVGTLTIVKECCLDVIERGYCEHTEREVNA